MFRFFQNTKRSLDSLLILITDLVADGLLFFLLLFRSRTSLSAEVLFLRKQASGGTSGGRIYVVFRQGEYCLYFLKSEGNKYALVDDATGRLPISRNLAADARNESDPMQLLEMDLKAGLEDSDHDRVLDSIRMLGNMRHLQSEAELTSLLDSRDMLVRTYTYQALLRLQDYSVLPAVEDWLMAQPVPTDPARMPLVCVDRMQFWLVAEPQFATRLTYQRWNDCCSLRATACAERYSRVYVPFVRSRAPQRFCRCWMTQTQI